jgi:hypothetical protein
MRTPLQALSTSACKSRPPRLPPALHSFIWTRDRTSRLASVYSNKASELRQNTSWSRDFRYASLARNDCPRRIMRRLREVREVRNALSLMSRASSCPFSGFRILCRFYFAISRCLRLHYNKSPIDLTAITLGVFTYLCAVNAEAPIRRRRVVGDSVAALAQLQHELCGDSIGLGARPRNQRIAVAFIPCR